MWICTGVTVIGGGASSLPKCAAITSTAVRTSNSGYPSPLASLRPTVPGRAAETSSRPRLIRGVRADDYWPKRSLLRALSEREEWKPSIRSEGSDAWASTSAVGEPRGL